MSRGRGEVGCWGLSQNPGPSVKLLQTQHCPMALQGRRCSRKSNQANSGLETQPCGPHLLVLVLSPNPGTIF